MTDQKLQEQDVLINENIDSNIPGDIVKEDLAKEVPVKDDPAKEDLIKADPVEAGSVKADTADGASMAESRSAEKKAPTRDFAAEQGKQEGDRSSRRGGRTEAPEKTPQERRRHGWFARFFLCCISFALASGLLFAVLYILQMEPFGTKAVTIDDAKIQYIDFFTYYVDVLRGARPLSYDFANMLGGSSFGLFSYYLASPFNLLLYFFGKAGVYRFFDIAVVLKLATAGATFCWYLQRRFEDRIRPVFVIALSLGYALMQYSIAQSSNIMWLDGVYMLPLMLLGVYEVVHRKSVWRLALATGFCILCNWYMAGVNCLFTGIWFLFEFFFCDRKEEKKEIVMPSGYPVGMRASRKEAPGLLVGITDLILSSCRYVWGMGLGVALSAGLFLPAVSAMRQGKGQYDEIKILMEMVGDLLSPVRGYVIGAVSDKGFAALFCGGIAVFAAAAILFSGSFRFRHKAAYVCLLGVCFLMLFWEPGRMAFSLLKRADSYWFRYSHLVCFALLFGAAAYLSRAERDRLSKVLVIPLSLLYGAAVLKLNGIHLADLRAKGVEIVRLNPAVFATVAASALLALLTVLLLCVKKNILIRFAAGLLLLAVTCAELGANAWLFWQHHSDSSQTLYMEYSKGLQAQLKQLRKADGSYYRIAQDRTRWHQDDDMTAYFNDSLAQNYWSNTAYTSSPENSQLDLMWRLGYRDEAGCMMIVRDPILASDSFLGIKYLLESTPVRGLEPVRGVDAFNGRTVYRNPYALPMAFVYDGSKLPTRKYDNAYVYQNALFSVLSGKETVLYRQLGWTRRNEGNKSYFRVFVPEGDYIAYGNLLWPEKMTGLMSINGAEPVGYCRWTSPASFMIRSREEQAASGAEDSLQAVEEREKEARKKAEEAAEAAKRKAAGESPEAEAEDQPLTEAEELQLKKDELAAAAAAFDKEALAQKAKKTAGGDIRTVVFRTEKGLSFKDYQFYGLDLKALGEAADRIRAGEVTDLTIENGHVTCRVQGTRGRSLCLLVPWSQGWRAARNGEIIQPDTVAGTMITVPLVDGENEIELTYEIPYLRIGLYISAAAFAVILLDALWRGLAARKKKKAGR